MVSIVAFVLWGSMRVMCIHCVCSVSDVGKRITHHYVKEGVGIACGLFISALTNVGLFTLTSTPLNAGGAICRLLERPPNERLFLLMPVGFPSTDATVPYRIEDAFIGDGVGRGHCTGLRKHMDDICKIYD